MLAKKEAICARLSCLLNKLFSVLVNPMDLEKNVFAKSGSFRYSSIAVQFVEPGVRIRLGTPLKPARWLCGLFLFCPGCKRTTAGASSDPALRSSRTYVHNRPVFVFLLPATARGQACHQQGSLPSVST